MKILITGSDGQLGRTIRESFRAHHLFCTDVRTLDITDESSVRKWIEEVKPDLLVNTAAYTDVDRAEEETHTAFSINAEGPKNLAQVTGEKNIPILHISTDYVFDGTAQSPYIESDCPNPQSVYGRSKWEGEKNVAACNPKHYIVRTAWLYSVHGRNFPKTMLSIARKQQEVRVVSDQTGSPTYAPHLAEALRKLIQNQDYGLWHLGGGGCASWYEWTVFLYELFDQEVKVCPVPASEFPRPAFRPHFSVLASAREPSLKLPPWQDGLRDFARDFKALGTVT